MTRHYTAHAAVRAERDAAGRIRLTRLRSDGPYALRATPHAVYLVGAAAGPLGGDELTLDLDVAAGASLTVRSTASTLLLPGDGESVTRVRAAVGSGAHLDLAPEPVIATAGCRHRAVTDVALADGATLRLREELVLGRHGEPPGRYAGRIDVTVAGRPLLRQELRLPDRVLHTGGAVLGDARCTGNVLLAGPGLAAEPYAADGLAVMPLAGPGVLVTALAPDSATLRRRLDHGECRARG
ncbi:urease accessory protein UreD [Actinomadura sp. WMMB 499]|uniref:urease accessory protein UreD n=1 Tax=Actinomadura sp. WMMB 499 TaxID=1219491 RepID=UPI001247C4E2|nr:urease accessory protein UreD [Actinomadura sp. WMMB 499]QFG20207.1 urease accessory protein UreD [Actinomadura sp. WMMB 499]